MMDSVAEAPKAKRIFDDNEVKKVTDGFYNFALKLGIVARGTGQEVNNAITEGEYGFNLVTRNRVLLEAAYRGSWIVGAVIDSIAEDMTKSGIILTTNEGAEQIQEFNVQMSRLQIWQCLCETIKWGRLYGGGLGVLQIEGHDLASPLDPETIGKDQFKGIVVYDRWQVWPVLTNLIESGPNIGMPAAYDIVLGSNLNDPGQEPGGQRTENASGRVRVHHTRCIRMGGIKLPFWQAITEMMWDESILERLWDRLIMFDTATNAAGSLMTRANLRVVKVDGFREILAAGGEGEENLVSQFEMMRRFQSNEGITLMDKEDEYDSTAYSFAGIPDTLIQFGQQISGATQIPLVRLFGQSPAGLSATGESDMRMYYDNINARQESQMRNPLEVIITCVWRSMTGQPKPKDLSFKFTPLWQMSALDKSTIATNLTNTILSAHESGVLTGETTLKELKQASIETGVFTHITDEDILEAESEEPPAPEDDPGQGAGTGDPGEGPAKPIKKAAGDSAWVKLKKIFVKEKSKPVRKVRDTAPLTREQQIIRDWLKK